MQKACLTTYQPRGLMKQTPTKEEMERFVDAGFTVADIAIFTSWSVAKTRYWLKKYSLKAMREKSSIGAKSLRVLLKLAFRAFPLEQEYHIGNRLRLDFYIPGLYTAFEVDGVQHKEVVGLFHKGSQGEFNKAKKRDEEKEQWCEDNNILLIRVTQDQAVDAYRCPEAYGKLIQSFRDKIAEVSPTGPEKVEEEETPASKRYDKYRADMNELGRKNRQANYRRQKAMKDKLKKLN